MSAHRMTTYCASIVAIQTSQKNRPFQSVGRGMPPIWASEKIATTARNSMTSRSKRSALNMRYVYSSARCRSHGSPVPLVARHVRLKNVRTYASRMSSEMSSGSYVSVQLSEALVGRVRAPSSAGASSPSEPLQPSTTIKTMPTNTPKQRTEQAKAQSSLRWAGLMNVGSRNSEPGGGSPATFRVWCGDLGLTRLRTLWSGGSESSTGVYLPRPSCS
mmetsp:Transcript_15891/g.37639  ORF Transcript_15891/g.37639 Transcript_15891/m.37639 type:complete len:217 (+) Transcript_15891:3255-3905(+)